MADLEKDYPGFDPDEPERPGPYYIVWGTNTPTSHTRLGQKEIWIREEDTKRPDVLAHEIAHSRLLRGDRPYPIGIDTEEEVSSWRELEAVLYTFARDQARDLNTLIVVLHNASDTFADGSLVEAKKIAKRVLLGLESRGHITESEKSKAISRVSRISRSKFEELE